MWSLSQLHKPVLTWLMQSHLCPLILQTSWHHKVSHLDTSVSSRPACRSSLVFRLNVFFLWLIYFCLLWVIRSLTCQLKFLKYYILIIENWESIESVPKMKYHEILRARRNLKDCLFKLSYFQNEQAEEQRHLRMVHSSLSNSHRSSFQLSRDLEWASVGSSTTELGSSEILDWDTEILASWTLVPHTPLHVQRLKWPTSYQPPPPAISIQQQLVNPEDQVGFPQAKKGIWCRCSGTTKGMRRANAQQV